MECTWISIQVTLYDDLHEYTYIWLNRQFQIPVITTTCSLKKSGGMKHIQCKCMFKHMVAST